MSAYVLLGAARAAGCASGGMTVSVIGGGKHVHLDDASRGGGRRLTGKGCSGLALHHTLLGCLVFAIVDYAAGVHAAMCGGCSDLVVDTGGAVGEDGEGAARLWGLTEDARCWAQ